MNVVNSQRLWIHVSDFLSLWQHSSLFNKWDQSIVTLFQHFQTIIIIIVITCHLTCGSSLCVHTHVAQATCHRCHLLSGHVSPANWCHVVVWHVFDNIFWYTWGHLRWNSRSMRHFSRHLVLDWSVINISIEYYVYLVSLTCSWDTCFPDHTGGSLSAANWHHVVKLPVQAVLPLLHLPHHVPVHLVHLVQVNCAARLESTKFYWSLKTLCIILGAKNLSSRRFVMKILSKLHVVLTLEKIKHGGK